MYTHIYYLALCFSERNHSKYSYLPLQLLLIEKWQECFEQSIPDRENTKFRSIEKHGIFLELKKKKKV